MMPPRTLTAVGGALVATIAAACTNLPPVAVAPAPSELAGLRTLAPEEVVLTGEGLRVVLDGSPDFAEHARSELRAALDRAGYEVVADADAEHDVSLHLSMNVAEASSSVTTGPWARLFGQLEIANTTGRIDTVYAKSHPDDAGRYYPSIAEAVTRVVAGLVNQMATSARLVEMTRGETRDSIGDVSPAAGPAAGPAPEVEPADATPPTEGPGGDVTPELTTPLDAPAEP